MARTRSTPKKTTGGKGAAALLKTSGKGQSARATKSARAPAAPTTPVKSPKKKLVRERTRAQVRRISNARVAIRLQLDTLYDSETAGFYSARDKATKPLVTIGEAAERALEEDFEEEGAGDGGDSSAEQKVAARKIIKTLSALL
ncbi:hypothetical protein Forpe1208_v016605 [Fusarium oxysporum f. sp. rapae]|uniref:Uncharacterized protein n=1 Tax=Fusarium oxysporum f. sp. rapae TaxID=485398 RepID=A0A8J5NI43_FUSOX|nr:hypothetical protein Forpe1208_v016485 [Fusarium oxysporum f. sp. rapae]KAG7403471.1 hypothetical protein Forpe1208_v016605 [Fusarium oxysporum f. sp. rapae]